MAYCYFIYDILESIVPLALFSYTVLYKRNIVRYSLIKVHLWTKRKNMAMSINYFIELYFCTFPCTDECMQ